MVQTTITVNLPPRLAEEIKNYVQAGWATDLNALILEALRRYLETHQAELIEQFIRQDIEWGLLGND